MLSKGRPPDTNKMQVPDISYTSPLMNRHSQLSVTLDENLRCVSAFKGRVEWVILNLKKAGADLTEWTASDELIRTKGADLIKRGWLTYVTGTLDSYHQCVCKNLVKSAASGRFLINLDIDNRISIKDTIQLLQLDLDHVLYHGFDGKWGTGSSGMFGLPQSLFRNLGGYNEEFLPYGYDEMDLMNRAVAATGYPIHRFSTRQTAIQNTDTDRAAHLADARPLQVQNTTNRATSQANIAAGRLVCRPVLSQSVTLEKHRPE
jgi:hypothetical protein